MEEEVKKAKPKKNVSDKYYSLPEEEMQELVLRAKSLDQRAQNELLEIFSNFTTKYQSLLYHGKFDLRDYDIRMFIRLFIPDKEIRRRVSRNQINWAARQEVAECVEGIKFMVRRYGTEEDVKHTVQMALLECISIYTYRKNIPFSGFIYNYFGFKLQKYLKSYLMSQLGRKTFPLYTDDSVSSSFIGEEEQVKMADMSMELDSMDQAMSSIKIDEYWVLGETCTFPFDQLTIQQRQLIRWKYEDGLKASHIAEKTTEHPNTCRAQIQALKQELKQILEDDKIYDEDTG